MSDSANRLSTGMNNGFQIEWAKIDSMWNSSTDSKVKKLLRANKNPFNKQHAEAWFKLGFMIGVTNMEQMMNEAIAIGKHIQDTEKKKK